MSKNDPYLKDAQAAVSAFDDGIMDEASALKRVWELMAAAEADGYSPTPYVRLSELVTDMKEPDDELEAEVFKTWSK